MKTFYTFLLSTLPALAFADCVEHASQFHHVNPSILRAIIMVETGGKPLTVSKNSNNTLDYGTAGINTVHLPELKKYGIASSDLMNPCINVYVAAWHLRKKMSQFGNTWYGIAAYHSTTPYYNNRYQILLTNALIDLGVIQGHKQLVPKLRALSSPANSTFVLNAQPKQKLETISSSMVVVNE